MTAAWVGDWLPSRSRNSGPFQEGDESIAEYVFTGGPAGILVGTSPGPGDPRTATRGKRPRLEGVCRWGPGVAASDQRRTTKRQTERRTVPARATTVRAATIR